MKTHPLDPQQTFAADMDVNLRPCNRHGVHLNRCIECWFEYLKYLGSQCGLIPRTSTRRIA